MKEDLPFLRFQITYEVFPEATKIFGIQYLSFILKSIPVNPMLKKSQQEFVVQKQH